MKAGHLQFVAVARGCSAISRRAFTKASTAILDSNCSMPKTRLSWRRWFEESIVSAASPKRPCVSVSPPQQRANLSHLKTPPHPRPYQEGWPHLSLLPHAVRARCCNRTAQGQGTRSDSATRLISGFSCRKHIESHDVGYFHLTRSEDAGAPPSVERRLACPNFVVSTRVGIERPAR
jgi:hypothetical protein